MQSISFKPNLYWLPYVNVKQFHKIRYKLEEELSITIVE